MNLSDISRTIASYSDDLRHLHSPMETLADLDRTWSNPLAELRRTEEAIRAATRSAADSFEQASLAAHGHYLESRTVADALLTSARSALTVADSTQDILSRYRALATPAINDPGASLAGIIRRQSAWEETHSLVRQVSTLSTGLASVLEAQRGPWIMHNPLAGSLLPSWSNGPGIAESLKMAVRPWEDLLSRSGLPACPPLTEFTPLYRFLLARSWYLSMDAPAGLVFDLADLHDAGDETGIEQRLHDYFRPRLGEIEDEIAACYPLHGEVTVDAFAIHRVGKFTLSIPAFFIISDMIALKLLDSPFFCFKENKKKARSRLVSSLDPVSEPSLLALFERGGLRKDTRKMVPTDTTFNRHGVVHGAHAGWHKEANSLRCIALIEYLHSLTSWIEPERVALPS